MRDTKPRQLTPVEKRSLEANASIASEMLEQIAYQHTVLCQTCLPYRNPGDAVRVWEREQGNVALRVEAGAAVSSIMRMRSCGQSVEMP